MDDSAFRYFGVAIVYKPCPSCGYRTAVGFDRNDPGVHDREATECTWCMAAKISNEVQFSRADPIPLTHATARPHCANDGVPAPNRPGSAWPGQRRAVSHRQGHRC